MADSVINTEEVSSPPLLALDAEVLEGAGPSGQDIYRERVQITGDQLTEIARVLKRPPDAFMYGLVVRPVGHAHNTDTLDRILSTLQKIEKHLASMSDEHVVDDGDEEP